MPDGSRRYLFRCDLNHGRPNPTSQELSFTTKSIAAFFEDVLDLALFGDGGVSATYTPGQGKLVLITGENATGKSLFRRLIGSALKGASTGPVELINTSMQARTGAGMDPVVKVMMFGDEGTRSTGTLIRRSN